MDLPHRGIDDVNTFDQYVARAIRLDEVWPQVLAFAEDSVFHRHTAFAIIEQLANTAARGRFIIAATAGPCPPILIRRSTVECSTSGDRDVFLLECVNERRVVHALSAFEARIDNGQVLLRISAE